MRPEPDALQFTFTLRDMQHDLRDSYDAVPYDSHPFPQTHPDRLATIAWLFGMRPAPVEHCRMLEIGCASGGNILPIAATLPSAQFVGVDFSEVQIGQGTAELSALGLSNARLLTMDITEFDEGLGEFDYIIAHGVYSWVPAQVRDKLLAVCGRHLAPHGVAYVSYNTLPGWSTRGAVREAMRYPTRHVKDASTRVRQARGVLEFLARHATGDDAEYVGMLRSEAEEVRSRPDYYVFHEHLEDVNEAFFFHEFIDHAARHGLRYLGEATFRNMFSHELGPAASQALAAFAPDLITREQMIDFLRNRTFRQTLLVREPMSLERKISPVRVTALHVATDAQAAVHDAASVQGAVEFRTPGGRAMAIIPEICKAAFAIMAAEWPASIAFDALVSRLAARAGTGVTEDQQRLLSSALLSGYALGAVELHFAPPAFTLTPGQRPCASSVARLRAEQGREVTTLRHEELNVDALTRRLLLLLDGTRTRAELASLIWPELAPEQRHALIEQAIPQLARQALLVA
ncbi:MAG: class I SAM-dependent methyltransferase [Pseudomonadota bacterium]|nr:class I SAM-dependent methyltransferase [Pseudomonadota bacterium]